MRQRVEQLLEAHATEDSLLESAATMDSTTDAVAAGRHPVIGNYKLLHKLGEGGFGVVYMAEQLQPVRRKVALKSASIRCIRLTDNDIRRPDMQSKLLLSSELVKEAVEFDVATIKAIAFVVGS